MQFLFHAKRSSSSNTILWMCRRCLSTSQQAIVPPTTSPIPNTRKKPKRSVNRNDVFFVPAALTPESRENVKSLQGDISLDKGLSIYRTLQQTGRLHWSLYSTYIPFLIHHQRFDDALQSMREALQQNMIHPHLYNLFLRLLYTKGHHDLAFNFLKEVGYTPYETNVDTWMNTLMQSQFPDKFDKAMELANHLTRFTSANMTTAYAAIFKKLLGSRQSEIERCLHILTLFKQQNEPIPDHLTFPLLTNILQSSNPTYLHQLVDIGSQNILVRAVDWYNTKASKLILVQLYSAIANYYPAHAHDFFLTLGPATFGLLWPKFAEFITPKFDTETKELRLEESDSCLLSVLATLPAFGEGLLTRMVAKSITVNPIFFEYKIETDQLPEDPEEVFTWYCRAITIYGVQPTRLLNNTVIYAFLTANKFERARQVFQWMKVEKLDISGIHLNFARYHLNNKEPEKAMNALVKETQEDGIMPTMAECDTLVNILGKGGYLKAAKSMCMHMHALKMRPTITTQFYMLKNTLKHEGLDDAFILLDRIYMWRLTPDRPVYELLLKHSIIERRFEKLDELRHLMRRDRVFLDTHLHNLFLDGYLKMGNETEAVNILQNFSAVGCSPDEGTYRILLQHHTAGKNSLKIKWLYNKIMDQPAQFVPSLKTDLAKAFLAINELDRGFRMAKELFVLKHDDIGQDFLDVMCFTACYDKQFAMVQRFLLELREENFLPSPSVIAMVVDRMAQAKFDFSKLAAAFGVTVPEPAPIPMASSPSPTLSPSLSSSPSPLPTPIPSPLVTTPTPTPLATATAELPSPATSRSPSPHPFVDLFPSANATPLPTEPLTTSQQSPTISHQPSPSSPSPSLSPTPSHSHSLPPTARVISPRQPTSSTLSPSSAPSSTLSRTTAFEFRDTYADLRGAHEVNVKRRTEFETRQKLGFFRYYFGDKEKEEEERPADPFKEYTYVHEESESEREERAKEIEMEKNVTTEKRDSKLREMFLAMRLW